MSYKSDPRYSILATKPTVDDIHITGNKLPTRKSILLAFISRKDFIWQSDKNKPCSFDAAKQVAIEEIIPFYEKARIPCISVNLMARKIIALHDTFKEILKINIERRESGKPKERIDTFKSNLEKTMPLWDPKSVNSIKNEEDIQFLSSMQTDRKASMAGIDEERKVETRKLEEEIRVQNEKKG